MSSGSLANADKGKDKCSSDCNVVAATALLLYVSSSKAMIVEGVTYLKVNSSVLR